MEPTTTVLVLVLQMQLQRRVRRRLAAARIPGYFALFTFLLTYNRRRSDEQHPKSCMAFAWFVVGGFWW